MFIIPRHSQYMSHVWCKVLRSDPVKRCVSCVAFYFTHSLAVRLVPRQSVTLLILVTRSRATRLLAELERSSGQSFALLFLFTHSIAVRLAPRQSVALLIWAQV